MVVGVLSVAVFSGHRWNPVIDGPVLLPRFRRLPVTQLPKFRESSEGHRPCQAGSAEGLSRLRELAGR